MKSLLTILAIILLGLPATAGESSLPYWSCMQVVKIEDKPILILSSLQDQPYTQTRNGEREKAFYKAVKKIWNITDEYLPSCRDFHSKKEAHVVHRRVMKKATKSGVAVARIEFWFGEHGAER